MFNRYLKLHKGIIQSSLSFYSNRQEFEDQQERPLSERLNVEHLNFGKRSESLGFQKQMNDLIDSKELAELKKLKSSTLYQARQSKGSKMGKKGSSTQNLRMQPS